MLFYLLLLFTFNMPLYTAFILIQFIPCIIYYFLFKQLCDLWIIKGGIRRLHCFTCFNHICAILTSNIWHALISVKLFRVGQLITNEGQEFLGILPSICLLIHHNWTTTTKAKLNQGFAKNTAGCFTAPPVVKPTI